MRKILVYLAQYVINDGSMNTEIIGVFSTVDKAKQAVVDTLIEHLQIEEEGPIEMILDMYSDHYMIDECTVNYNYMV